MPGHKKSKVPFPEIPEGKATTMARKVERRVKEGQQKVTITLIKTWEVDPHEWDEWKEHVEMCEDHPQIVTHYDAWSLDHHLMNIKQPDKVEYRIK